MQDYIPRGIDINGTIDTIECRQFDNNSRFLRVKLRDDDLAEDNNTFDLSDCSTALYIRPESGGDVSFINGTVESPSGVVTFLIPGSVTQAVGNYLCQIRIYEGDETDRPVISSKPFRLTVDESIADDAAIEATPEYSALTMAMTNFQTMKNQMAALVASPAGSGGDVGTEVRDARVGWDGTTYASLGEAVNGQVAAGLVYLGTFLNKANWEAYKSGGVESFDALPNNIFAVCNIGANENTIEYAPVSGAMTGLIVTFGRKAKDTRLNFDTQMFIPQDCEKIYIRKYNNSWSDWSVVGGSYISTLPQFRSGVDDTYSANGGKLSNITDDGTFYAKGSHWSDVPATNLNFIITNARYSDNWLLQTAVSTNATGIVYNRLIPRTASAGEPREWVCINNFDSRKKVLAVGDSIARGWRNGGIGYAGLLGLSYNNVSESGATISTSRTDVTNIPAQLDGVTDYQPDIIIADGGLNDYIRNVTLGDIPTQPVTSATVSDLDLSTVMGGLQKLFYLMITKYPGAKRYFVITHKVYSDSKYYVTEKNTAEGRYTQQDLHDAIVDCCKAYNVEIIDVYERGIINTLFDAYRSQTHYTYDAQDNWASARSNVTDFVDADGVHPLERGYLEGYVPLIREAIRTGTVKN